MAQLHVCCCMYTCCMYAGPKFAPDFWGIISRGLSSILVKEEVFDAIVTMVYAVLVMGEVDKQFSAWLGGNEISQGFLNRDSDGEQFKTY